MEYYIEAIRAAAEACDPRNLKNALDFILDSAQQDYRAGALAVTEYGDIITEYDETLRGSNALNYT